jgi:hypothetical protein
MMGDWISKLEKQKNREAVARKAQTEREQRAENEYNSYIQRSYERNKNQYERVYDSIEKHAKRASDAGFDVRPQRRGGSCMNIVCHYTYYDYDVGNQESSNTLELIPWGYGFLVHYNDRVIPNRKTHIYLFRVTDRVIADWVRWTANDGPNDPIGARRMKIICWVIGIMLGLWVLLAAIPIFHPRVLIDFCVKQHNNSFNRSAS